MTIRAESCPQCGGRVQLPDAKSGVPVFEWLIPADWEFEGAVRWRDSGAGSRATIRFGRIGGG